MKALAIGLAVAALVIALWAVSEVHYGNCLQHAKQVGRGASLYEGTGQTVAEASNECSRLPW